MHRLHAREELYLRDTLYDACGGERKKNADLKKVQHVLSNFPELVNDVVGPKRNLGTSLITAVKAGDIEIVRYILSIEGLNVYKCDEEGWTALHWAVLKEKTEIVQELVKQRETTINHTNDAGRTPFHICCLIGNVRIAQLLLELKIVKIHIRDKYGDSPLHLAVMSGYSEIIRLILQKDCRLYRNKEGQNPFHVACCNGKIDEVRIFLHYPVDIELKEKTGNTGYQLAQHFDHNEVVELLTNPVRPISSKPQHDQCTTS